MTQYALERKKSVVRRMLSSPDLSIRQLSQETDISAWSLYDWRKQAIKKGEVTVVGGKHSGRQRKWPPSHRNADRHGPGILTAITSEGWPPWTGTRSSSRQGHP